jgi:hypothetical protein
MYKMKQVSIFLAVVFATSLTTFAQANYSGSWELDKSKSKLDERMGKSVEGQTLTVSQTANSLTVEVKTKTMSSSEDGMGKPSDQPADGKAKPPETSKDVMMTPPPTGAEGIRKGGTMSGGDGVGDGITTYSLDGKETTTQQDSPMGSVPVTCKAKLGKDGSLQLSQTKTISGPNGEMTISTRESWTLSSDGKTLNVKREADTLKGKTSSELVYEKDKGSSPKMGQGSASDDSPSSSTATPESTDTGATNDKAPPIPKPVTPKKPKP